MVRQILRCVDIDQQTFKPPSHPDSDFKHADRWLILAILTFTRTVMGFQFQSVTAAAAPLMADFNFSYAELGTLIGLYLLPGAAVALPSGVLSQRFDDKRIVCVGMAAMALGAVIMTMSQRPATRSRTLPLWNRRGAAQRAGHQDGHRLVPGPRGRHRTRRAGGELGRSASPWWSCRRSPPSPDGKA
jgi:sugar phosphate permease